MFGRTWNHLGWTASALLALACSPTTDDPNADGKSLVPVDADGDGFGVGDCDDGRADINPEAREVCDGVDNDCDPSTSEHHMVTRFAADGTVLATGTTISAVLPTAVDNTDVVKVCQGGYDEVVHMPRNVPLHLVGVRGSGATFLQGRAPVIDVDHALLTLEGFTITATSPFAADGTLTRFGGGIKASGGAILRDVALSYNQLLTQEHERSYGGGMHVSGGACTLEQVRFVGNAASDGGGLYATVPCTGTDVTFEENEASHGGGVYLNGGTLSGATFTGNTADEGGAAYLYGGTVRDVAARGNSAGLGGAIYADGRFSSALEDATLAENAASWGSGIYVSDNLSSGSAVFTVRDTITFGHVGSPTFVARPGSVTAIARSAFTDNATDAGNGVLWIEGQVGLDSSTVYNNSAGAELYGAGASLFSTATDWGQGNDDNNEFDVLAGGTPFAFGSDATFTCTGLGGC